MRRLLVPFVVLVATTACASGEAVVPQATRLEPKVLEQTRPDLSAQLGIHQYELWADRLQHDVCLEMTVLRGSP